MQIRDLITIAKQSFSDWSEDGAPRLAAALAYYTVFSLAPLLFLIIAIAGLVVADAQTQVIGELSGLVGEDAAAFLSDSAAKSGPSGGIVATIIGVVVLLFGAAGVFGQLQEALNIIWEVRQKPGQGIWGMVRQRFFSFALVGGCAFLLMVSLIASTVIAAAVDTVSGLLPGTEFLWQAVNFAVSLGLTSVIFAIIFKAVPDAVIAWRDVWLGAVVTGVLFSVGQVLLGLYLGMQSADSVYGAAGSLIVVLLWVYYAAQILFLGAEVTQVTARWRGSPIRPSAHAEWSDAAVAAANAPAAAGARPMSPQEGAAAALLARGVGYAVGARLARGWRRRAG